MVPMDSKRGEARTHGSKGGDINEPTVRRQNSVCYNTDTFDDEQLVIFSEGGCGRQAQ